MLGSFPSPKSREQGFFYGHPQNRMWNVLARVFDEPVPATVERRRDFLLRNHIAMWDVLASCTITGASDASIADEVPNDLTALLDVAAIREVYCAGATASRLYAKHLEAAIGRPCIPMPSTSPANAAVSVDDLVDRWRVVRECVRRDQDYTLDVADVVALEAAIAKAGTSLAELMDRAGTWLAYRVHKARPQGRVTVLAGNGNNGGDGWVAARELARWGHVVVLVTAKPPEQLAAQPARDAALAAAEGLVGMDAQVVVAPGEKELEAVLAASDVVVDAILGTGFSHDQVRAPFDGWIHAANARRQSGALVVSADCPSGLNAQTGAASSPCIQADETVTMITSKTGLSAPCARDMCGNVVVARLCDLAPFAPQLAR